MGLWFIFAVYFDKDILFGRKESISLTNNDKPILYVVKTDFVQDQEPVGTKFCAFSAAQEVCSKLENQAK